MGALNFHYINPNNRVPGYYFEVDASQANTGQIDQRSLLITQMLPSGTATPNQPFLTTSLTSTKAALGIGSMGSATYTQYRNSDQYGEVWVLPVSDNAAGAPAVYTFSYSGSVTTAGTIPLYINFNSVQIGTPVGTTAAQAATATVAAINALPDLTFKASTGANGAVVLTAKHVGVIAGQIDVRFAYYGSANAEAMPVGLTASPLATTTPGSGDPILDNAIANLGDQTYDFIHNPYTGSPALLDLRNYEGDAAGTWSPYKGQYGGVFSAYQGTTAQLQTWGITNNDQHLSIFGYSNIPMPSYIVGAEHTAQCAISLRDDPALTLTEIVYNLPAPAVADRFTLSERNTLLYSGISTFNVNTANQIILERACTTYQQNAEGVPDNSYLDVETLYCIQAYIRQCKAAFSSKFGRKKLVADTTVVSNPGDNFITAAVINAEQIAQYQIAEANGIMQDSVTFAKKCYALNVGNGRVQLFSPLNVMNQLREIDILVQFSKS